ncbi:MAG: hypothetical protein AABX00_06290 [Nanoarchaeota archaeon]
MSSKTPQKEAESAAETRVNIGLKEKIHVQAKIISTLKKIPLNKFLEQAIEEAVEKNKDMLKEFLK